MSYKARQPAYSWSMPTLMELAGHRSPDVRTWAVATCMKLYPEAGEPLLQRLPEETDRDCALELLFALSKDLRLAARGVESLKRCFHTCEDDEVKAGLASILIRLGHAPPGEEISSLPIGDYLEADTEPSFEFALRAWVEGQEELSGPQVVAGGCGAGTLFGVAMIEDPPERAQEIARLAKLWGCKLPDLVRETRGTPARKRGKSRSKARAVNALTVDGALGLLENALAATEAFEVEPERFPVLARLLQEDRRRAQRVLAAMRTKQGGDVEEPGAVLVALTMALHRDSAIWQGLLGSDNPGAWLCRVSLRGWRSEELDPDLLAGLERQPAETLLLDLRIMVESNAAFLAYPIRMLREMGASGWPQLAFEAMQGDYGEDTALEADDLKTLMVRDAAAMDRLLVAWREAPPETPAFCALLLGVYPTEEATTYLLAQFERYMSLPHSASFVEAIATTGSRRFLEPLLLEWRSGEIGIGRTIWRIAEIHGLADDEAYRGIIVDTVAAEARVSGETLEPGT